MKKFLCLCFLVCACQSANSLKVRQDAARDACWKVLAYSLASDLRTMQWTSDQGFDLMFASSNDVFPDIVEESLPQWSLKSNRAKISTVYGGWQRIEYVCNYNPIGTKVTSLCYSDHPGECK